jgi:hypothetical protein
MKSDRNVFTADYFDVLFSDLLSALSCAPNKSPFGCKLRFLKCPFEVSDAEIPLAGWISSVELKFTHPAVTSRELEISFAGRSLSGV